MACNVITCISPYVIYMSKMKGTGPTAGMHHITPLPLKEEIKKKPTNPSQIVLLQCVSQKFSTASLSASASFFITQLTHKKY